MLFPSSGLRTWATHCEALQRGFHEPLVMRVCARDGYGQRNAASIRKKGTLGSGLASIRRIGPRFFSRPAEPSSSRRPDSANANRSPLAHHIPRAPLSRGGRRHPALSIAESTDAECSRNRTPLAPQSIGSPSGERREFHRRPGVGRPVDDHPACPRDISEAAVSIRSHNSSGDRQRSSRAVRFAIASPLTRGVCCSNQPHRE